MTKLEELAVGAAKNMASMLAEAHGDLHKADRRGRVVYESS